MTRKTVCLIALVAALIVSVQSALAQNYKSLPPKRTIQDYGPFTNTKPPQHPAQNVPFGMCGNPAGHCLFYGGDFAFNPVSGSALLANGLANENDTLVFGSPYGAATWAPFTVPAGQVWSVTGLFSNDQSNFGVLDQAPNVPTAAAYWAIMQGIQPGIAGTTIASGTSAASINQTGRFAFGLAEYTVQVEGLSVNLTSGTYWMIVVPLCTNAGDAYCGERFFLSDVEWIDGKPKHAFGPPEPLESSFFDSPFFFFTFGVTNGPLGACGGFGCDAFSVGVIGTKH
jgi:hypothetical protein